MTRHPFALPRLTALLAASLGILLRPASALAQANAPAVAAGSPLEPGLMILITVGILVAGGLLFRLLLQLKIIRSAAWLIPILLVLSGILLLILELARPAGMENLLALARFLFTFLAFVAVLHPMAVLMLPTAAQQTRKGVPPLIRLLLVGLIAVLALLILVKWSFPELSLTPMFVTSGVVSIVLGLAVQDLLSNLLAGVVISLERPFKVGDWVGVGQTEGEVLDIGWRATKIRTRNNDCVLIPNNVTARESVVNYEEPTPLHLVKVCAGVAYETPCGLAVTALLDAAARVEGVLRSPAPDVHLRDFADSCMQYELRVWIENYAVMPAIESDVRKEIWYSFKRNNITIPFPQRDVNVRRPPAESPQRTAAQLIAVAGPLRGATFQLGDQDTSIGRGADCTISLPDLQVSNRHAVVGPDADGYSLKDLGSRHGTLVNGEPVQAVPLEQGDEIRIGSATFVYESSGMPAGSKRSRRSRTVRAPTVPPPATPQAEEKTGRTSSPLPHEPEA